MPGFCVQVRARMDVTPEGHAPGRSGVLVYDRYGVLLGLHVPTPQYPRAVELDGLPIAQGPLWLTPGGWEQAAGLPYLPAGSPPISPEHRVVALSAAADTVHDGARCAALIARLCWVIGSLPGEGPTADALAEIRDVGRGR